MAQRPDLYREAALRILSDELNGRHYDSALNVVDSIVRSEPLWSREVANTVAELLSTDEQLRASLPSLAPSLMLQFLRQVDDDLTHNLVREYLRLLEMDEIPSLGGDQLSTWRRDTVEGMLLLRQRLTSTEREKLRGLIAASLSSDLALMDVIVQKGAREFLSPEILRSALAQLTQEHLAIDERGELAGSAPVRIWLALPDLVTAETATYFVQRALELVQQIGTGDSPRFAGLMKLVAQSREALALADAASEAQLVEILRNLFPSSSGAGRLYLVLALMQMHPRIGDPWPGEVAALVDRYGIENLSDIGALLANWKELSLGDVPEFAKGVLSTRLRERFSQSGAILEQQSAASILVTFNATFGWEAVEQALTEAIAVGNIAALHAAIQAQGANLAQERPLLLSRIAESLVGRLSGLGVTEQELALAVLSQVRQSITPEIRQELRDVLLRIATSEQDDVRAHSAALLRSARDARLLGRGEREYLVDQIVLWLAGRPAGISGTDEALLDYLVSDIESVRGAAKENLITLMTRMLGESMDARTLAARYIAYVPMSAQRRSRVVGELIGAAKGEDSPQTRAALVRAAYQLANRRGAGWRALREYLEALGEGSDQDQALAAELLAGDSNS